MIVKHLSNIGSFPELWSPLLSNLQRKGTLTLFSIHAISHDFYIDFLGQNIVFIYFIVGVLFYFDLILEVAGLQVLTIISSYIIVFIVAGRVSIKKFYYIIPSIVS